MLSNALFYSQERNRRRRSYQAYLADLTDPEVGAIVGSEVAAASDGNSAWRSIGIGVATGALTYLVTRLLESMFKGNR